MRARLASLLVTSLVLSTTTPVVAGGKKRPAKKAPKAKATAPTPDPAPAADPAPAPDAVPVPPLGDPVTDATPSAVTPPAPTPAPQTPAPPLPAKPPTKEAKAQAKALQKEATKLYNVQQYEKAADLYQQAYLLDPNPAYLYASAQSQRLGGNCTKALQSYQAYIRANPPESERAKAQANIDRCEQELRDREAAVNAEQVQAPYEVPQPPMPREPDVVQPISMCLDDRGRVWVAEGHCYPIRRKAKGPVLVNSCKGVFRSAHPRST